LQDAQTGGASGKVFEGVPADDMAQRKDLPVRRFAEFCYHVKASHNEQI